MNPLKQLKVLARERLKEKHPTVPEYALAVHKYTDKTANGLTRAIIDWLNFNGHHAERVNSTGRVISNPVILSDGLGGTRTINRSKWIPGTGRRGTADIHAIIAGQSVMIEVKIGRDKQSAAQKDYQQAIISSGGRYWIIKTFDSFMQQYYSITTR